MRKIYFNRMQREACLYRCNKTVVCAGRGTGKGLLHAAFILENFQAMPRSTTAFVVPNARRGLTNTLPSMFCHWEAWGYKRGVHWVVGQRPPRNLQWPDPIYKPESYENIISFYTGAVGQIVSQDRKGTSNSKSFDFIDVDEAKFVDFAQLKSETIPANRGQVQEFGHLPYHHGMLITSDMPMTTRGSWFLNYEKDCDPKVMEMIRALVAERWAAQRQAAEAADKKYWRRKLADINARLDELRRTGTFFGVYPSLVNLEVLGEAWFRQMRRDLPPSEFRASIMCQRVKFLANGFYSSLGQQHLYNATDFGYMDSYGYDLDRLKDADDCRMDSDLDPDRPLCIAFDYNANINCLCVGQPDYEAGRLRVVRSFFTKYERKLPDLLDDFCRYYAHFHTHTAVYYYDNTALGSNYAVNSEDFHWVVIHQLEQHGWAVVPVYIGQAMRHLEKQLLINRGLDGRAGLLPLFNEQGNESLLASMRGAGVYNGKKDKRMEKLDETEESPLEERTDFSDAFDTLYIGCDRFPQYSGTFVVTSDFM